MKHSVVAIGLDAADPALIEKWMSEGHLPTLSRLRQQGAYGRIKTFDYYRAETPWTTFLTGCSPEQTGYWSPIKYKQAVYDVEEVEAYDFSEYPPFYALGEDYQVAVFDMPQTALTNDVGGVQVLAWGAHSPMTPSHSQPAGLLEELSRKHGEHPRLRTDHASCMNVELLQQLKNDLNVGVARRAAICQDLLQRQPWDLFLTIFGETHSAGHYFWHLSQDSHPLYPHYQPQTDGNPLLDVFVAVDQAIANILDAAPDDAHVVVFSAHGMGDNVMDLPSMVFLPELLYRWSLPNHIGLAQGKVGAPVGKEIVKGRVERGWIGALWGLKHDSNRLRGWLRKTLPNTLFKHVEPLFGKAQDLDLTSPFALIDQGNPLFFQPAIWYQPFWPQMKAFALPSYSEGYIRINVQGREPQGIVTPEDYDQVCDDIIRFLQGVRDARTGKPMVAKVVKTRTAATDCDPKLPDADLVVIWQEDVATDTVDSPIVGRVGPIPYSRTGSHRRDGFILAQGPTVEAGADLPAGHALDLAPTLLQLMRAPIPHYMEGRPLVKTPTLSV